MCKIHKRTINTTRFRNFLIANVQQDTILRTCALPVMQLHPAAVQLISGGADIWQENQLNRSLIDFRQLYLEQYSAFPTNTQFVERGVKESGFVALGRRDEKNRTILALSRSKVLPEALALGRALVNRDNNSEDGKKK